MAELKNRLNTHGENIPKGARKADLVALLIQIETNLLKGNYSSIQSIFNSFVFLERKAVEIVDVPADPPTRKTRRKK